MRRNLCVIVTIGVLAVGVVWMAAKASMLTGLSGLLLAQADPAGLSGLTGEATTQPSVGDTPAADATVPASPAQQPPPQDQNANPPGPSDLQAQVPTPEAAGPSNPPAGQGGAPPADWAAFQSADALYKQGRYADALAAIGLGNAGALVADNAGPGIATELLRAKVFLAQKGTPDALAILERTAGALLGANGQSKLTETAGPGVKDAMVRTGMPDYTPALRVESWAAADPGRSDRLVKGWARLWAGQILVEQGDIQGSMQQFTQARRLSNRDRDVPSLEQLARVSLGRVCQAQALAAQSSNAEAARTLHWQALLYFGQAFHEGYSKRSGLPSGTLQELLPLVRGEIDALGLREWGANWMRLAMEGADGDPQIEQLLTEQVVALGGAVLNPSEPGSQTALPAPLVRMQYPSDELLRRAAEYERAETYEPAIALYRQAIPIAETSWHAGCAELGFLRNCALLGVQYHRAGQTAESDAAFARSGTHPNMAAAAFRDVALHWADPDKAYRAIQGAVNAYGYGRQLPLGLVVATKMAQDLGQDMPAERSAVAKWIRISALAWNRGYVEAVEQARAIVDEYLDAEDEVASEVSVGAVLEASEIARGPLNNPALTEPLMQRLVSKCPEALGEPIGAWLKQNKANAED